MASAVLKIIFVSFILNTSVSAQTKKLVYARKDIMELGAKLNSLEKDLSQKNRVYNTKIENLAKEQKSLEKFEDDLTQMDQKIHLYKKNQERIVRHYLLNEEREVVGTEVYTDLVQQNLIKLQAEQKILATMEERANLLRKMVEELQTDQENLYQTITDLESRKKQIMETYLSKVEKKNELEEKIQEQKLSVKMSALKKADLPTSLAKPSRLFRSPLNDYEKIIASEKGVTFKLTEQVSIRASAEGRVVYTGELANYGKVLMIDHGDDLRSVMLGQFDAQVVKNQQVKMGEVIGQTLYTANDSQPLYFEIRKKNTAQKTILWLDQSSLIKI